MTTIVNSPPASSDGGISGMIIGLFVFVVLGLLFYYFGLPTIRRMGLNQPQINTPNQIEVDVKQVP